MRSCIRIYTALVLILIFTGCSAHYQKGLKEFEQGKTSSFYQRTRDWTMKAESETSGTRALALDSNPLSNLSREPQTGLATSYTLIAQVLHIEPRALENQFKKINR